MIETSYQVAVLLVSIHIPEAQSLKQKRTVLKSLKDRARAKFNVTVSELGGQDKWQVATLGFGIIGNDGRHLESCVQSILSFMDAFHAFEVCEHEVEFF